MSSDSLPCSKTNEWLNEYYEKILKNWFEKKLQISDLEECKKSKYSLLNYDEINKKTQEEQKKFVVGHYFWYFYPHCYKIIRGFRKINDDLEEEGIFHRLKPTRNGHSCVYIVDIGAGLLTGLFSYCCFLLDTFGGKLPNNFNCKIFYIANEPNQYQTTLYQNYIKKIQSYILYITEEKIEVHIKHIQAHFPDSISQIKEFLEKQREAVKDLIILNACILKWLPDTFEPQWYEKLFFHPDRIYLLFVEPGMDTVNYESIINRLDYIKKHYQNKIDIIKSYPQSHDEKLSYWYYNPYMLSSPKSPQTPHERQGKFRFSYVYLTNLTHKFFTAEKLQDAYYKTRLNIITSPFYDKIDLILFDQNLENETERIAKKLQTKIENNNDKQGFIFSKTLDYLVHKGRKDNENYIYRPMSIRKIDNEVATVALIEPMSETDRWIEWQKNKPRCSFGNRLTIYSKTRFYQYFLDNWLEFKQKALDFARQQGFIILKYDLSKYYEMINTRKVLDMLFNDEKGYCCYKGQNKHLKRLAENLLTLKCYTTVHKDECIDCFKRNSVKSSCNERYGLPQGPITSGFFANIYLYPIDETMLEGIEGYEYGDDYLYLRYVDDILIVCHSEIKDKLTGKLKEKANELELEINSDKTHECSTPEDFEQTTIQENIVNLTKKAKAFLDPFFYLPSEYFLKILERDYFFLNKYKQCLQQLGINIWDLDFLHKKAQLISKYNDDLNFKKKIFGKEIVSKISTIINAINFPPIAVVDNPEIWKEEFAYKNLNLNLINKIDDLRIDILNKIKNLEDKFDDELKRRELRVLLYSARIYYHPDYKNLGKKLLEEYPYMVPYRVICDLISGINNDEFDYLKNFLLKKIKKYNKDYVLLANLIRHLSINYPSLESFKLFVECMEYIYKVQKTGKEKSDEEKFAETPYRIVYLSEGYLVLLLALTEGILFIPYESWTTEEKNKLFIHLQKLCTFLQMEQDYEKEQKQRILYSFKKSLKRNMVTIMSKILENPRYIELSLQYTPSHIKESLQQFIEGKFLFRNYITRRPPMHNPAEYVIDEIMY